MNYWHDILRTEGQPAPIAPPPRRQWLLLSPGDGRLICSLCGTPERWNMRGVCACFVSDGRGFLRDTSRDVEKPR